VETVKDEAYSYQVLTVAFPDYGNAYMTTARAGEISQHFSMNNKGLYIGASGAPGGTRHGQGLRHSLSMHFLTPCSIFEQCQGSQRSTVVMEYVLVDRGLNYTFADTHQNAFVIELTGCAQVYQSAGPIWRKSILYLQQITFVNGGDEALCGGHDVLCGE